MKAVSNEYKLFVNMKAVVSVIDMGTRYTLKFTIKNLFVKYFREY